MYSSKTSLVLPEWQSDAKSELKDTSQTIQFTSFLIFPDEQMDPERWIDLYKGTQ